jgi:hypothetical protein
MNLKVSDSLDAICAEKKKREKKQFPWLLKP